MPEVGVAAEQPIQFAAFFLGWTARTALSLHDGKMDFRAFGSEVLVASLSTRGTHTLFDQFLDDEDTVETLYTVADLVADLERGGRLCCFTIHSHVARLAFGGRQRASLALPDAPQPDVDPNRIHVFILEVWSGRTRLVCYE